MDGTERLLGALVRLPPKGNKPRQAFKTKAVKSSPEEKGARHVAKAKVVVSQQLTMPWPPLSGGIVRRVNRPR